MNLKKINSKKIYKKKIYKNYNINYSIIAYKDNLYISDNLGNIHCLKIKNLEVIWKKNFGVAFRSNIKINKDDLFLINSNSKIFSINIKNGNLNWSFETSSGIIKDDSSYQIAIYNDKLFFTNDSSEIYCLNLVEKTIMWSLTFENDDFSISPLIFKSSPITIDDNGILYVSNNNGNTYSIDANKGFLIWSSPIYSFNRFIVSENYLFNIFNDYIFIIDKKNGKILFNKKILSKNKKKINFLFKDLLVSQKNIYIFDIDGYLITLDKSNLANYKVDKYYKKYSNLILAKNFLYINSGNEIYKH